MADKRVDESWKESVDKEKSATPAEEQSPNSYVPEADFSFFVTSLAMQALSFMGEIENPTTKEKATDLPQAQYLIEILEMLSEKTKNNLKAEESQILTEALYALKLKFVEKAGKGK